MLKNILNIKLIDYRISLKLNANEYNKQIKNYLNDQIYIEQKGINEYENDLVHEKEINYST